MNNSDRSHDLTFLFDKEESLLSVLTIVFIFINSIYLFSQKLFLSLRVDCSLFPSAVD